MQQRTVFEELKARGMIEQTTHPEEIAELFNHQKITFYVGFDPTATSFHVGQLAVFTLMRLLQKAGHQPILLMGAATGMIGDPSGKSAERNLLDLTTIQKNIEKIREQMLQFLPAEKNVTPIMVNNYDWLGGKLFLEFLRDVGKHFSVNQMITLDSVANRIHREGQGITYTEFSYILLQSYDFLELFRSHNCVLQIGGADQWGNIVYGIDLVRRVAKQKVYGLTLPLLTKSDGSKFGKSEQGTVWLAAEKTSPYKIYQFFLNQSDADVLKLLKVLTLLPLEEIEQLAVSMAEKPHLRKAQERLAKEIVTFLHGEEAYQNCLKASQALFGKSLSELDEKMVLEVFEEVPSLQIEKNQAQEGLDPLQVLCDIQACPSKGEARKLIAAGGFYVNNQPWKSVEKITLQDWLFPHFLILRSGKKNYYLLKIKS